MGEHWLMPSFNFMLLVDGAFEIPLKSVQPFSRENEYEPIQEGGMNDYVYLKRKPISQPFKLVIERYVNYNITLADPLSNGTELLLPLLLFVGNNAGGSVTYTRYFTFTGAVVMSKQYGGLDAEKSGLLTETITFGYNHMFCTTLPLSEDVTDAAWKMTKSGGEGKRYSVRGFNPTDNDAKQADFEKKAALWEFKGKERDGKGKMSHATPSAKSDEDGMKKSERRRYIFGMENNPNYKPVDGEVSTRSARTLPKSTGAEGEDTTNLELTKSEMMKKAFKYEWDENGVFTGNGQRKARLNDASIEKRADKMIKAAKVWEFDKKTKAGKGNQSSQNYLVTGKTLEDGKKVGLGIAEDSKETYIERAKNTRGAKNTNNKTQGNKGIAPRKWRFDEKNKESKDGLGDRSRQNAVTDSKGKVVNGIGVSEASKEDMGKASKKWRFARDKYVKEGNKVQSAKKIEGLIEEDPKTLAEKAKRWDFDDRKKEGDGERSRQNAVVEGKGDNAKTTGMGVTELDKETMSKGARKWNFSNSSDDSENVTSHVPPREPELPLETMIGKAQKAKTKPEQSKKPQPRSWKFDDKEPATKAGQGTASRVPPKTEETSRDDMAKKTVRGAKNTDAGKVGTDPKPRMWEFDEQEPATKAGQGTASRVPPRVEELSKDQMAGKAVKHVKQSITDFLMG